MFSIFLARENSEQNYFTTYHKCKVQFTRKASIIFLLPSDVAQNYFTTEKSFSDLDQMKQCELLEINCTVFHYKTFSYIFLDGDNNRAYMFV